MRKEEGGRRGRWDAGNRQHRTAAYGLLPVACLSFLVPASSPLLPQKRGPEVRIAGPREAIRPPAPLDQRAIERIVAEQINAERHAEGLAPLKVSPELSEVARRYSQDMVERAFFAHQDPDGGKVPTRVERAGISDWAEVGENIARNQGFDDPAGAAVRDWMKSRNHRANILAARYHETGIGVWIAPDKTIYVTQIFLKRKE